MAPPIFYHPGSSKKGIYSMTASKLGGVSLPKPTMDDEE
jgi:hypothetical protein